MMKPEVARFEIENGCQQLKTNIETKSRMRFFDLSNSPIYKKKYIWEK